jgi:hypothetical protein
MWVGGVTSYDLLTSPHHGLHVVIGPYELLCVALNEMFHHLLNLVRIERSWQMFLGLRGEQSGSDYDTSPVMSIYLVM